MTINEQKKSDINIKGVVRIVKGKREGKDWRMFKNKLEN